MSKFCAGHRLKLKPACHVAPYIWPSKTARFQGLFPSAQGLLDGLSRRLTRGWKRGSRNGVADMDNLKEILQAVDVWAWLQVQFPELTEAELLAAIADDFDGVILDFQTRRAPSA